MNSSSPVIYVVDDDRFVRRSLEQLLQVTGYQVKSFDSPRDFLGAMPLAERGCVILDLKMPELNGLAVQQALLATAPAIPIIFLSAHGDVPSSVQAMKAGAADFLVKPIAPSRLLDVIRQTLEKAAYSGRQPELDLSSSPGNPAPERSADDIRNSDEDQDSLIRDRELLARECELSAREREVFARVAAGRLNKQIAADLGIALQTVKSHRARVMQKLGANSLSELVRFADRLAQLGVLESPRRDN